MDKLLEKEIVLMCQLAAALLEENPLPVKKAAARQRISDKTVRRLIASRPNESAFFNCHITTGKIRSADFKALLKKQPAFIADLLHKSQNLALLILSMKQPVLTFPMLGNAAYMSTATLHRRFVSFAQFLSPYLIDIDRRTYPFVKGNERQIRFLLFKLTTFLLPSLYDSPSRLYQHFFDIHILRQQAIYPSASCITVEEIRPRCFVPDYYLTTDAAYLFLWKQLLAQEPFFVPTPDATLIRRIVDSVLQDHVDSPLADSLSQIYQIHLVCALLEGNIFVFQPALLSLSETTVQLIQSFLLQLPHYEKLLKKHPELPLLYECIWHKQSIFQPMLTIKKHTT